MIPRLVIPANGTGLRDDSVLFCEKPTTIDRSFLKESPCGRVSDELMDHIVIAVRRALVDIFCLTGRRASAAA